jgi:hypothetical protein
MAKKKNSTGTPRGGSAPIGDAAAEVPANDGVSPGVEGDRVGWRGTQDG